MGLLTNILNGDTGLSARQKLNILMAFYNTIATSDSSYNLERLEAAFVKSNAPGGKFLRDDGTWQTVSVGESLNQVLGHGNDTNGKDIILTINDIIKSSKLVSPASINFGTAGDEIILNSTKVSVLNAPTLNYQVANKKYVDDAVVGLLDFRGSWDASTNLFPTVGGSSPLGFPIKGDLWYVSVAGTLAGKAVTPGDSFIALVDIPGQTAANWNVLETNIGFVPLNSANLQNSLAVDGTGTKIPTVDAIRQQLDLDSTKFIIATAITDPTQITALDRLVDRLHYYNLWDKGIEICPIIGGNAATHKFNLKDARDLDIAHRLIFSGGITHSSTGMLPNGTNGHVDTKVCMTLEGLHSFGSYGFYSRTNVGASGTRCDIGVANGSTSESSLFINDSGYTVQAFSDYTFPYLAVADTRGFFLLNKGYDYKTVDRNGVQIMNNSTTIVPNYSPFNVTLFAKNNNGVISQYSNKECAFLWIGKPLTVSDRANLYTLIQEFQTTLGRQV